MFALWLAAMAGNLTAYLIVGNLYVTILLAICLTFSFFVAALSK
jgi:hypothetical protein